VRGTKAADELGGAEPRIEQAAKAAETSEASRAAAKSRWWAEYHCKTFQAH
jgi:hypothetical protein